MAVELVGPGYSVIIPGRAGLRYREGHRTVAVDGEMQTGPAGYIINARTIAVWVETSEPISSDDRQRILSNIEALFRENGIRLGIKS